MDKNSNIQKSGVLFETIRILRLMGLSLDGNIDSDLRHSVSGIGLKLGADGQLYFFSSVSTFVLK